MAKYVYFDAEKDGAILGWIDTEAQACVLPDARLLLGVSDEIWEKKEGYLYVLNGNFVDSVRPSFTHDWSGSKWVLNKAKQAELDAAAQAQAITHAVDAVKHALQAHIDAVAIGLGFSGGNTVMLYAGFANAFQPLAQAFGAWEAGIWAAANKYMAQVKVGEAPMLTPEQAVERVPSFAFAGA